MDLAARAIARMRVRVAPSIAIGVAPAFVPVFAELRLAIFNHVRCGKPRPISVLVCLFVGYAWRRAIRFGFGGVWALAAAVVFAAPPSRIVILSGADPTQPAALVQIQAMRNVIQANSPAGTEIYLETLDGFRFDSGHLADELFALLKNKYAGQPVDLVIVLGNYAAQFAIRYHDTIWEHAPVLVTSVPESWLEQHPIPSTFSLVPYRIEIAKTLVLVETLQPHANHLVVVGGVAEVDRR
ncbi:hypothetical protein, partial [Pandoraea sp. PE-S2R-1]|uniref:hypothetical protein n=1 Tax=Pandoraea sp. PE-S2R-1 TaxID=1986994 RepID=UPI0011312877